MSNLNIQDLVNHIKATNDFDNGSVEIGVEQQSYAQYPIITAADSE